jgi:hypothetical protein
MALTVNITNFASESKNLTIEKKKFKMKSKQKIRKKKKINLKKAMHLHLKMRCSQLSWMRSPTMIVN